MALDRANIFKLEKDELKKYENNPFMDCFESTKTFAEALKRDIETKELPHVLLLKANYGMGKTFFATRFTLFLRHYNKTPINTIYFSAWENDYLDEPIITFSKIILSNIVNFNFKNKIKNSSKTLSSCFKKVIKATKFSADADFSFKGKGLKCGLGIDFDKLIDSFKEEDPVVEFKNELSKFIKSFKNERLVIIVDELDRCRPDYAMKVLECIKHFFDVKGIFIIIPTNETALNKAYESLYGGKQEGTEWYFKKFFNDESSIKTPTEEDYKFIIEQYVNEVSLKNSIVSNSLTTELNKFNSINTLVNSILNYSYQKKLSFRELAQSCSNLVHICNILATPIRVEYLSYFYIKTKTTVTQPVVGLIENAENPLMQNGRYKSELLSLEDYFKLFNTNMRYNMPHPQLFSNYLHWIDRNLNRPRSQKLQSYSEFEEFINAEKAIINETREVLETHQSSTISGYLDSSSKKLEENIVKIKEYQKKYGSDDNDTERKAFYEQVINRPEILHNT